MGLLVPSEHVSEHDMKRLEGIVRKYAVSCTDDERVALLSGLRKFANSFGGGLYVKGMIHAMELITEQKMTVGGPDRPLGGGGTAITP